MFLSLFSVQTTTFLVFPVPTILLQFIFVLVSIAIEGTILRRLLQLTRRTSIEYAASINLLNTILGWLIFFSALPLLPKPLEGQLISYIFFDRLLTSQLPAVYTMIILTGFTIFLVSFLVKLTSLKFLQNLLDDSPQNGKNLQIKAVSQRGLLSRKDSPDLLPPKPNQAVAILVANACSYSALLVLLVVRFIQLHYVY